MLKQWAQANARYYGLVFESVDVALLGVADSQMMTESGERGGVFCSSSASTSICAASVRR